ncbi:MAG: translation initiation factor IF-3 [Enterobacteriaceae bacterium]
MNDKMKKIKLNDVNGKFIGIFSLNVAILKAEKLNLDLVKINSNTIPPIYKLMNYGKFLYIKKQLIKKNKKIHKIFQIKEIKLRSVINDNDYNIKIRNIIKFLEKGNKTKIFIKFKGREIIHKQLGLDILNKIKKKICEDLKIANIEFFSEKIENNQLLMILTPK